MLENVDFLAFCWVLRTRKRLFMGQPLDRA